MIKMSVSTQSGVSVVRFHGDLNFSGENNLIKPLGRLLDWESAPMVLDMSEVGMINSAGLGDLVRVAAQSNSQGGHVVLANLTPFVAGVLETTKLNRFLSVCKTIDDAVAKLTG